MKGHWIGKCVCFVLLAAWGIRYLYINEGHIGAYPSHPVEEYSIGETVFYEDNISYYQYQQNGCVAAVQSARTISFDAFCTEYSKSKTDFMYTCDAFIEVTLQLTNQGDTEIEFGFAGLMLRGRDWWCSFMENATAYANGIEGYEKEQYGLTGITIGIEESYTLKLVYGIQKGNFPLSRWEKLEEEDMWIVATINPIEKRIRIQ